LNFANTIGYPVLVRPSYVLSGAAMGVASNDEELKKFLQKAVDLSKDHPTVISKFLENAKELEFDGVAANGVIVNYAISEHVENAGVHSGDATLVLPPQRTYLETMRQIKKAAEKIADALMINGPFNIQFIAKQNNVKVIECNLRASRSFPFVSKTLKDNFIETVKAPEFSFTRLEGADPTTGVEMASTGEVACFGNDFNEAFLKALISVGYKFPVKSVLISSGSIESKAELLETSRILANLGIKFYATPGTAEFMTNNKVDVEKVYWPSQKKKPNVIDLIKSKEIDLVINIPKSYHEEELTNDYTVRRAAVDFKIPLLTNRQLVMRLAEALEKFTPEYLQIKSWDEYN
jgi:carbamoyl-phosphate synthase large subunit